MKGMLLAMIIGIFLAVNLVSAQQFDIYTDPTSVWTDDTVHFECICNEIITDDVYTVINTPEPQTVYIKMGKVDSTHYSSQYIPQVPGDFEVYCTSFSAGTEYNTSIIFVRSLDLDIDDLLVQYTDDDISLELYVYVYEEADEPVAITTFEELEFDLYVDGQEIEFGRSIQGEKWTLDITGYDPDPGAHTLRVVASYDGKNVQEDIPFEMDPAFEFEIGSMTPEEVLNGDTLTIYLTSSYHQSNVLPSTNVSVYLDGQEMSFEKSASSISFDVPAKGPGSYILSIEGEYGELSHTINGQVDYVIPVHGETFDADDKGVYGTLTFSRTSYSKNVPVTNGIYSGYITTGTYEVRADFDSFDARFTSVPITGEIENIIRYDKFTSADIAGLRIVGGYALEFSPAFNRVYIEADYDAGKLSGGDESGIEVYKCHYWNLDARKCRSINDWVLVDSDVNTGSNRVLFEVDSLSGFVIGEPKDLEISATLDMDEYFYGEVMHLTGVVKDQDNKPVDGATVEYSVSGSGDSLTTDSGGIFSADIIVPKREGNNILILNTSKTFYHQAGEMLEFKVFKREEIELELPQDAEVTVGETGTFTITIRNTGDIVLDNAEISFTGLPKDSSFAPHKFNHIDTGGSKDVQLTLTAKEKRVLTITAQIDSDQLSYSDSFVIRVNDAQSNETVAAEPPPPINFTGMISLLSGSGAAAMNIISVIASVVVIAFLGMKANRKRKFNGAARDYIVHFLNTIKKEVFRDNVKSIVRRRSRSRGSTKKKNTEKPARNKRGRPKGSTKKPAESIHEEDEYAPHMTGVG